MKWWKRWRQRVWVSTPPPSPGRGNIGGEEIPTKLAVEPIIGRRLWRVARDRNTASLVLQSIHFSMTWEAEMVAKCQVSGEVWGTSRHKSGAPGLDCACGLYAMLMDHTIGEWWHAVGGRVHASGDVALSGRVIKCTRGYKAQYAKIVPPVFLDVSCSGKSSRCPKHVTKVALPGDGVPYYFGYCKEHEDPASPLVDADVWLKEAARELSDRYDLEVLHWR